MESKTSTGGETLPTFADPMALVILLSGVHPCYLEAGDKTRTCDRLITNQLLYQLSYTSKSIPSIATLLVG